ncbi:putative replication initiation protein [Eel River basin pequenovirus]|nr:putative replication initiation protein [Eel River basin pequenovirus]
MDKAKEWAIRCYHEAQLHEENSYVTFTYRDEDLPEDRSVDVRHFQLFMKRLRKNTGVKVRYFHCGEYGEQTKRPHYHALLFGYRPTDQRFYKRSKGHPIYTSESLDQTWGLGHCNFGNVTFESAGYVARYIMKKVTGEVAEGHYSSFINPDTGELLTVRPEYVTMSRNPGLGADWVRKFREDLNGDYVVVDGKKHSIPRFYDEEIKRLDEKELALRKRNRKAAARKHAANNTRERLAVREKIQYARLNQLRRS